MPSSRVIALVAGEASGDLLGAQLVTALKALHPDLQFEGVAGPRMIKAGVKPLYPISRLAVSGYWDVLWHLRDILAIRQSLKTHWSHNPPLAFIGIDAPDFNLQLEKFLKRQQIPTIHYVSPSIWAWRAERIGLIRQAVDRMLNLFPFETAIYEKAGIPVSYVGHPLADLLSGFGSQRSSRVSLDLDVDRPLVALLPGSRLGELKSLGQLFIQSAKRIHQQWPQVQFVAPMASLMTRTLFEKALEKEKFPFVKILDGQSHEAILAADVALVASGTATLETALLQTPMVISYRLPWFNWLLMKPRAYLPYVGLPNILAGESIVPELLQTQATAQRLSDAVMDLLRDPEKQKKMKVHFSHILQSLKQDAAVKAAKAISEHLRLLP
jgi:lipid-A-disaccharide synthase